MYLNEAKDEQEKRDLALIIEEVLRQRYEGVKNEEGVWITPAFPKLIYVLEEDNVHTDSPYYYLTELAAKCTAKRLVPDLSLIHILVRCTFRFIALFLPLRGLLMGVLLSRSSFAGKEEFSEKMVRWSSVAFVVWLMIMAAVLLGVLLYTMR